MRRGAVLTAAGRAARAHALRAALTQASPAERARLEVRIERAVSACGCTTGSAALLGAAAVAVAWWAVRLDGRIVLWPDVAVAGLLVLAGALLGKLAGLAAADAWLWWTGRRLRDGVAGEPA